MKELFPGIYQIPLTLQGFAPGSVNAYLVREKEQCTLIDTGWDYPAVVKSMEDQLEEVGIHFNEIKRIFITHCHGDHLGMMERFQKVSHAVVYLHHKEMDIIKVRYSQEKDERSDAIRRPENALRRSHNDERSSSRNRWSL